MHGWCVAIRGVEGGGLVQGLPTHTFETDEGEIAMKCPTEVAITDRREKEFADNGFIPLVHCKGTDYAAFLRRTIRQQSEKIRHRRCQCQCAAFDAITVYFRRFALRSLFEINDARQSRFVYVA